jgi:uncharacterized protein
MMRRFILILFLFTGCIVSAQEMPKATGWVNDFAGVIPDGLEQRISALCGELNRKTGAELTVATIQDLGGASIQGYANELFQKWGIGKKGEDNGVLILLAVSERKIRVEVGYGLEPVLTDGRVGRILDQYAVPSLSQNDFGNGLAGATAAIAATIADSAGVSLTGEGSLQQVQPRAGARSKGLGIIPIIVFIILMIVTRGRILPWLLLIMMSGGGRGGGGGFGGGGFGGGFGGFGGGSSGGGGAGRSF